MNLFDLGLFAIFAYLGYTNAGDFVGNLFALATFTWAWQIVVLEMESRQNKANDSTGDDEEDL
jgi:hypothetical protein